MATLTDSQLGDLNKGCAKIKLIDIPSSPSSVADYDFSDADIFKTKEGFTITQEDPSTTDYKLDQADEIFDTDVEKGALTLEGFIPSTAKVIMDYFLTAVGSTAADIKIDSSTADYSGYGYSNELKQLDKAVAVISESGKTGLMFTNVRMFGVINEEDGYRGIKFKGTVLASGKTGIPAIVDLTKKSTSAS